MIDDGTLVAEQDSDLAQDMRVDDQSFSDAIIKDRYLCAGEDTLGMFRRVAEAYKDNDEHGERLFQNMRKKFFMPATPILSNGGTKRGLPISCFLNEVGDSLEDIVASWNENIWLSARGGGIGTYWGNVRSVGEHVHSKGKTSGIIPFISVQNALTLAISQGSLRRGSGAVYLPVDHPEIEEFIQIRRTSGDLNRKALNMHNAVIIPDAFMHAVSRDDMWALRSPVDGRELRQISARTLWTLILTTRIETGEPYLLFIDTVNENVPEIYKKNNLKVRTSNLCNEIVLSTGVDYENKKRTAVCCLSSLNIEHYDRWPTSIVEDSLRLLDNVLSDFISSADEAHFCNAIHSARMSRDVGLGVMGLHSYFQSKMWPFESPEAEEFNRKVFEEIRIAADKASVLLAKEKGPCPDALRCGINERFTHKIAVAPTASISVIAGNTSPGIEPYVSNAYTQKTLTGSFAVRNKFLARELEKLGRNNPDIWSSIVTNEGSVQHLDFLPRHVKDVFKTAYELDQSVIVRYAADRAPYIDQSQSVNIFMRADVHKKVAHEVHFDAWRNKKLKGLYYLRSTSVQRRDVVSNFCVLGDGVDKDSCESCQ